MRAAICITYATDQDPEIRGISVEDRIVATSLHPCSLGSGGKTHEKDCNPALASLNYARVHIE